MGHRYIYSAPQMFDGEHEQNWNHMQTDQHCMHQGRNSTSENAPVFYHMENMSVDDLPFTSHLSAAPAPSSNGYGSSSVIVDVSPHQQDPSGSTHDHFLHSPAAGFCPLPENYVLHGSSSTYERQSFQVVEGGFYDVTMGSGRGRHKRKSPEIPSVCERGSTSRYFDAGSATDLPTSESRQEKQTIDSQYLPWDHVNMTPPCRGNGILITGDGSLRNVRNRSAVGAESNLAVTHMLCNHPHIPYCSNHATDQSGTVDLPGQGSSSLSRDWSQTNFSHGHQGLLFPDTCGFRRDTNHFLVGSNASNAPLDMRTYHHEFSTRNPSVPQSLRGNSTHSVRGARTNYCQRSNPSFRASSSSRMGHVGDGLHEVTESYPARHSRLASTMWRNSERNGRSRVASERYRSLTENAALHDRFSSEGFVIVDRASFYGSRNIFDQHTDMRMDIDNMTYEELLALGERIGHVSTGLSEDLISKCMAKTIYCSSDQSHQEGSCVICLEEYKEMDNIGALKTCGHDYHVNCIMKWLAVKNICPICKASAMEKEK